MMEVPETGGVEENVGLLVLEPKSLRPFKTKDEYLYAMKEDLAEWFTCLYKSIEIDADNFLEVLETGVLLCEHANEVRKFTDEQKANGALKLKSNFGRDIQIPTYDVQFRRDVKPGTFLARDNISNFITWTSKMGIPEVLRFETDDLVMRKNERSVVLCLLEVARVGAKFGMLAPTIVQMEEEIDNEIETGEPPPQIITCDVKSLDEMVRELVGRCTCPVQFPIIKVGEGKYKIGDNQTLVFVRILRKHVMIRVGGGWDTLEHYLDRHDPCRCGFQGHGRGGGRAPTTPRRTSIATQSQPNTPKSARKFSLTAPVNGTVIGSSQRPASPSMRSASPGPNARKLSLAVKSNSKSQPGSSVTSPAVSDKQPTFSSSVKFSNVSQNGLNSSGSFVKQAQSKISRQHSSNSTSSSSGMTPRRSASPALRPQSPANRRSESPVQTQTHHRLRSPSPAVTTQAHKPGRTQSVPASPTGRCSSPMKQITLSELRSSREGNPQLQPKQQQPSQQHYQQHQSKQGQFKESLRRQLSNSSSISEEMMAEATSSGLSIEQISTMSLSEFKNILNSSLAIPNGHAGSQGSSDSPRSQSSVESPRAKKTDKYAHVKSSYSYRNSNTNTSANKTPVSKTASTPGARRSSLEASTSSGYSSSSAGSDRTVIPSAHRPKTPTSSYSVSKAGAGARQSSVKGHSTSAYANNELNPSSANNIPKSYSNVSSISDAYSSNQYQGSRSSSHSSLRSYESGDSYQGQGHESCEQVNRVPLTPSSVDSDYSLRSSKSCPTAVASNYSRSTSYTPCSAMEDKTKWDRFKVTGRASSEPKETFNNSVNQDNDSVEVTVPKNVGYFHVLRLTEGQPDNKTNGVDDDDSDLEQEFANVKSPLKEEIKSPNERRESSADKQSIARPCTPSGRKTPSMIPRPMTPKLSKQMSVPLKQESEPPTRQNEQRGNMGRPPTPKKSSIIAKAPAVRSADSSKEKSYQEIFRNRSTTPGPGTRSTSGSNLDVRRSSTPGPYLSKTSTLSNKSATVTRTSLNESLKQSKPDMPLSVFNGENRNNSRSRTLSRDGSNESSVRSQSVDRKKLVSQKSLDEPETVIQVSVNRESGQHVLTVEGENGSRRTQTGQKSKVLARARTDDTRSRTQTRTGTIGTKPRPQSVEPRQLIPRKNSQQEVLTVTRGEQGEHKVYDRTQEWVQTAVEQTTKVQKTNTARKSPSPHVRRAMTPNSFSLRIDMENEEPKTLDEIKAELTLPINGINLNVLDLDKVEAPPEDPEMYAQMEKMFHELRQQELKKSVNETPGSSGSLTGKSSKSKSTSSNNDEEMSLDSNKNVKRKTLSVSTKSSSNVTSPALSRANKGSSSSSTLSKTLPARPQSASRTSSTSSVSGNTSTSLLTPARTSGRPTSPSPKPSIPAKPTSLTSKSSISSASSTFASPSARPASPRTTVTSQRPPSPRTTVSSQRPPSPRTSVSSHGPPSPRTTTSQPPRPQSPSQAPRPSSPCRQASARTSTNLKRVSSSSNVSVQPPRPASTPPRATTPVGRQSSKSSDDSDAVFESEKKNVAGTLFTKLKEIIKVKPRKDKAEGVKQKSRIPAPKSLATAGKSKSFSNLCSLSNSMSLVHTDSQNYCFEDHEHRNGFDYEHTNGGLNSTLPARSETPAPRLITPLATGRSTLIRKESMDKNKTVNKFVKAVSVDRELSEYQNRTYEMYEEGEFV